MRIAWLVPGSGSAFYCENCVRDRVWLSALAARGHDITAVPLYLPVELDAGPVEAPVFFGGINVHLQQHSALFRATPPWFDRLLDHPWMLHLADRMSGMTRAEDLGQTTLSMLRGEDGRQAKELERLLAWLEADVRPQVIVLSNLLLAGLAAPLRERTGARLLALMQDEDEFIDALPEPERGKVWAELGRTAAAVDRFVGVSRYHGGVMRDRLSLPDERLSVVLPGVRDEVPRRDAPGTRAAGFLSRRCPERGYDLLAEAFVELRNALPDATLRVAGGALDADRPYIEQVHDGLRAAGALEHVHEHTRFDLDGRDDLYRRVDVLVAPDRGAPAFAGYAVEAMAAGVPVIASATGCFVELAEILGDGLVLVPPDDAGALALALTDLMRDPEAATERGLAGRARVLTHLTADASAAALEADLGQLATRTA